MRFVGKGVVRLDELMKGIGSTKVVESKIGSAKSFVGLIVVVWQVIWSELLSEVREDEVWIGTMTVSGTKLGLEEEEGNSRAVFDRQWGKTKSSR